MTARGKIISIIVAMLIIVGALIVYFVIRVRYNDPNLIFARYAPKDQLVTKVNLLRDINIMQTKDGIRATTYIFLNKDNLKDLPKDVFWDNDRKPKEGNVISMALRNRAFTDSKKPLEVKFLMRIMLYLRERKLSSDVGEIIGIAGGFTRNEFEKPDGEGEQLIKMSTEEFEALYKDANVSNLDTEKQIDTLTDLWIKKTGYWRRGLSGREEK